MDLARCKHYVERKRRYCKLTPMKKSDFCGEHQPIDVLGLHGKRISCPLDPSHTVFENNLDSHLIICNNRNRQSEELFRRQNANIPNTFVDEKSNQKIMPTESEISTLLDKVLPAIKMWTDIYPIEKISTGICKPREEAQTSAISAMVPVNSLDGDYTLIEIGAGKARLTHQFVIDHQSRLPKYVYLVDRSRSKAKFDCKIRNIVGHTERLRYDLRDFDPSLVPIDTPNIVIIAKHACGAATCFSLTAIKNLLQVCPYKRIFISIATCCHQMCSSELYCNPEFLKANSISFTEFFDIKRLSSWAICDLVNDFEIADLKRSEIGVKMKLFIDIGRCQLLQSLGMKSFLSIYCDVDISPENKVIVASRV